MRSVALALLALCVGCAESEPPQATYPPDYVAGMERYCGGLRDRGYADDQAGTCRAWYQQVYAQPQASEEGSGQKRVARGLKAFGDSMQQPSGNCTSRVSGDRITTHCY